MSELAGMSELAVTTDRLAIAFTDAEGAVVRILGAVERRGYRLGAMVRDGDLLTLDLAARDPGRRLDVLAAQLRRLHDVRDVTPSSQASISNA